MKINSGKALILILCGLMLSQTAWPRGGFGGHGFGGWGYGRGFYGYGLGLGIGYGLGYGLYGPYGYAPYGYGYGGYYPPRGHGACHAACLHPTTGNGCRSHQHRLITIWHYCRNPEGYYPYVKLCPAGWEMVAPHPAR